MHDYCVRKHYFVNETEMGNGSAVHKRYVFGSQKHLFSMKYLSLVHCDITIATHGYSRCMGTSYGETLKHLNITTLQSQGP